MKVTIINGPNLNLLGKREPGIYGDQRFEEYLEELRRGFPELRIDYFQSNYEGALVEKIQEAGFQQDGIVLNAAAYTHTSVAIADAVAAVHAPVIEVHISNVHTREAFRHQSYLSKVCCGVILGFGTESYRLALHYFNNQQKSKS